MIALRSELRQTGAVAHYLRMEARFHRWTAAPLVSIHPIERPPFLLAVWP